jgi:UDP-GlcNAc:undecaprenyl-phosphate GlcNAc-1-phosphate transferase
LRVDVPGIHARGNSLAQQLWKVAQYCGGAADSGADSVDSDLRHVRGDNHKKAVGPAYLTGGPGPHVTSSCSAWRVAAARGAHFLSCCGDFRIAGAGLYLGKVRVYEAAEPPPANTIIRVLADFSYKRRIFEVMLDLVLVVLAYYGAYLLRFDGDLGGDQLAILKRTLPVVIVIQMLCFLIGGMYRGIWRYAGIADLLTIGKSVFASLVLTSCAVMGMYGFRGPSRAVLVLDGLLLLFFVGASRVSFRLLRTAIVGRSNHRPDAKPVLIYGAGDGGELLIREIINNPDHLYTPIGFIDDDQRKAGKLIHGIRVFDAREVQDLVRAHSVCEVLVSSLKVPKSKIDDLQRLGIGLKKMSIRIE